MEENVQIKIEQMAFDPDFYRQNFRDDQAAADFLNVSQKDWLAFTEFYGESTHQFIYTMRLEDVLSHLCQNPYASLGELAAQNGFRSRLYLLWYFYKQHHCTPRRWAFKMGLVSD